MPFVWVPPDNSPLMTPELIRTACHESRQALHNLRAVLPQYESLIKRRQPVPEDPGAAKTRYIHFRAFDSLVKRLEGMHQRHCTATTTTADGGQADQGHIPKTRKDFEELAWAMPFQSLLEVFVKSEREFFEREQQCNELIEGTMGMISALRQELVKAQPDAGWENAIPTFKGEKTE